MKTVYLTVMLKIDDENIDINEAIADMEYDFIYNEEVDGVDYNIVRSMEVIEAVIQDDSND